MKKSLSLFIFTAFAALFSTSLAEEKTPANPASEPQYVEARNDMFKDHYLQYKSWEKTSESKLIEDAVAEDPRAC